MAIASLTRCPVASLQDLPEVEYCNSELVTQNCTSDPNASHHYAPPARLDPDRSPRAQHPREDGIDAVDQVALALGRAAADSLEGPDGRSSESALPESDSLGAYLGEIGRMRLLAAEEEIVLAKAIELGRQIVVEPEQAIFSLWDWTRRDTERDTRASDPAYRLPFAVESERMVRSALRAAAATDTLPALPDIGALGGGRLAPRWRAGARGAPRARHLPPAR